jgi:hypothetical protein
MFIDVPSTRQIATQHYQFVRDVVVPWFYCGWNQADIIQLTVWYGQIPALLESGGIQVRQRAVADIRIKIDAGFESNRIRPVESAYLLVIVSGSILIETSLRVKFSSSVLEGVD